MPYNFNDDQLKEALLKADEFYLNSLPKDEDITYQFSRRFERNMKKLIRQSKKKKGSIKPFQLRKQVAILVASIIILFASSMSVSAVRKAVFDFVSNVYEKYTEIFFNNSEPIPKDEFVVFKPTYIPDGFAIDLEELDLENSVYLKYVKDDDYIIYEQQRQEEVSIHINTEGIEVEETEFNGYPAKYYSNQGVQNLIWYDDIYMYFVSSTLSRDKVYHIAQSVK